MPLKRKPSPTSPPRGDRAVTPSFVGGAFVRYCVAQHWLALRGTGKAARYLVTPKGKRALRFFGIEV